MNIVIDPEFQSLIPPLSSEEKQQLEENIIADGCRDPLVIWPIPEYTEESTGITFKYADHRFDEIQVAGEWRQIKVWDAPDGEAYHLDMWPCILIDGHNRHEICTRLDIPFEAHEIEFSNRGEATEWIIKNQFGRRNISDYQRGVLALKLKPVIEERARANQASAGGDRKSEESKSLSQKSDEPIRQVRTDEAVSDLANISRDTIRKVEKIEATAPDEVKALAGSGDVSINLASQFVDLPKEDQDDAIYELSTKEEPPKEVISNAVKNYRALGTGENEWYTPSEYADMVREVMGSIDLDPASCEEANETVKAKTFYSKEDDGLSKQWVGKVWLNPPYSRDLMPKFVEKLKESYVSGDVTEAILVSHNNTDTAWFHSLSEVSSAICFPKRRIRFYRGENIAAPTNGQAFFYLGSSPEAFQAVFGDIGLVLEPMKATEVE